MSSQKKERGPEAKSFSCPRYLSGFSSRTFHIKKRRLEVTYNPPRPPKLICFTYTARDWFQEYVVVSQKGGFFVCVFVCFLFLHIYIIVCLFVVVVYSYLRWMYLLGNHFLWRNRVTSTKLGTTMSWDRELLTSPLVVGSVKLQKKPNSLRINRFNCLNILTRICNIWSQNLNLFLLRARINTFEVGLPLWNEESAWARTFWPKTLLAMPLEIILLSSYSPGFLSRFPLRWRCLGGVYKTVMIMPNGWEAIQSCRKEDNIVQYWKV